jgi:hypothetical protein
VRREVEDGRVAPEHLLRPVAVVHVPVDHGDALDAASSGVRGGDGDVVEQAEPHGLGRPRVVPRRAEERHPLADGSVDHRVDHRDQRAGGEARDVDALRGDVGVRIEVAGLAAELAQGVDEAALVDAGELFVGGRPGGHGVEDGAGRGSHPRARRHEPLRSLGVVAERRVGVEPRVVDEERALRPADSVVRQSLSLRRMLPR